MNRKKLVSMAAAIAAGALLAVSGGGAAQAEEQIPHLQPLLQLQVPNGGHFFTASLAEERMVMDRNGFKQMRPGTGFVSPRQYKNLLVPLYRCQATNMPAWLLTINLKELDQYPGAFNCDAIDEHGHNQGHKVVVGYVSPRAAPGLHELLRMDNGYDSMIVLKGAEGPWLTRGFHVDGSLGFVYTPKDTDPLPALALWKPGHLELGAQYTLDIHDADSAIIDHGLEVAALHLGYWRPVKFAEANRELYRYTVNHSTSSFVTSDRDEVEKKPNWKESFHYDGPVGWVSSRAKPGLTALVRYHMKDKPVWILSLAKDEEEAKKLGLERDGVLGYVWAEFPVQVPAGQPPVKHPSPPVEPSSPPDESPTPCPSPSATPPVKPPSPPPSPSPSVSPSAPVSAPVPSAAPSTSPSPKPGLPKTGVVSQVA